MTHVCDLTGCRVTGLMLMFLLVGIILSHKLVLDVGSHVLVRGKEARMS